MAAGLELARDVLRQVESAGAGERRAVTVLGDGDRLLAVAEPLRPLLPAGGLRRGSTVTVRGSTSLLLALLAEASAAGAWSAVIGMPGLGLVAAAEAGVDLARLALVPAPGTEVVGVTAALLDGLDVVAVAGVARLGAAQRQRLAARARSRGSVLLPLGPWPGADVELTCSDAHWSGLVDDGSGRLRAREVRVHVGGKSAPGAGREATLLLPAPDGAVQPGRSEEARQVRVAG
ncbi:MAG: hypothetical protein ACR2GE_04635 [Pseudonocardia sp.]